MRISEDTAYDFDFLFTILKYIKKVRVAPVSGGTGEKGEQPAKIPPSLSKSVTLAPVQPKPASDASSVEHSSEESEQPSPSESPPVRPVTASPVASEVKQADQTVFIAKHLNDELTGIYFFFLHQMRVLKIFY